MKNAEKIDKLIKNKLKTKATPQLDWRIDDLIMQAEKTQTQTSHRWRIIMKSKMTKFAAAAAVVLVAILGLNLLSDSTGPRVYAATIKALENVNTIHISGWTTKIRPKYSTPFDEKLEASKQYAIETWEWFDENGKSWKYSQEGPITVWEDSERYYEYQSHYDRLYIRKASVSKSLSGKFRLVAGRLETLKERGIKITELETRLINGRNARGFKTVRDSKRVDFWIDMETDLMLEGSDYSLENGVWVQWRHGIITYDQKVPNEIRTYAPPQTDNIDYAWDIAPRFEKWHLHLRKIAAYYQKHPLPETMELLTRESNEQFDSYSPGRLPGISDAHGYRVQAIPSHLGDFLRGRIKPNGSLRVPLELQNIKLNHDLVTHKKFSSRQRADFVLDCLGLEIIEITEDRKVWVANWNGQTLKQWPDVKAPVPNPDNVPTRAGMSSGSSAQSMEDLFNGFVYYQGYDLEAKGIVIVDETGIRSELRPNEESSGVAVSSASPYWRGEESIEIAKRWFKEEFGVTFTEEIRPMTVYVVQSKNITP